MLVPSSKSYNILFAAQASSSGAEEEALSEAQRAGRQLRKIVGTKEEGIEGEKTGRTEETSFCEYARQQVKQSELAEIKLFYIPYIYIKLCRM